MGHLEAMLRYVVGAAENLRPETVRRVVDELLPGPEGGRIMATLAERWKEEGRLEGKVEGKAEGKREELLALLEDALETKYGGTGIRWMDRVRKIHGIDDLRALLKGAWTDPALADFERRLADSEG